MHPETEELRIDLQRDIAESRRVASWSSALTNVLITLALVSGAMSAAILAYATDWPRWVAGVLAMVPGTAMALQGKLFEKQINHHRMREVAYHGLLDELVYEGGDAMSISRRRRQFRERSESDWQKSATGSNSSSDSSSDASAAAKLDASADCAAPSSVKGRLAVGVRRDR